MALLGDDGRGYELARKLECLGVWRQWLGDSLYNNFVHFLSSPSSWDAFMRTDDSKSRAQIQLQLRARALLFEKASVSLFLRSSQSSSASSSSLAISKLNPSYLQLHGDDVYFTLENSWQDGAQLRDCAVASGTQSKMQSKTAVSIGSRYCESELDGTSQRVKLEELPESWYNQFFEKYRTSRPYKLSFGNREMDKRTPEQMSAYLRVRENHKRKRIPFREEQIMSSGNPVLENGSTSRLNSVPDENNAIDDAILFFPETMFTLNCVPESAVSRSTRVEQNLKVEFNGALDNLPQIMTKSPIMIERLGIRPEYLSMEQGGNQNRGKNGLERSKKLGPEQASQMSHKAIARLLSSVGFEGASEVPMEVLSQLLSCHVCKLGRILKLLADSYRKQCSAIDLIKMFLQTSGYSNLGALAELVKDNTRNIAQQTQQQVLGIHSQFQPQQQVPIRHPQQVPRQMHPQMQQMIHPQNLLSQNLASHNLLSQSLVPQNLTSQSLVPQNLTSQSLVPQNLTSQSLVPQNLTSQSLVPQNLTAQSLMPQNLTSQNLVSQNLTSQSLVSQNLTSRSMSPQNMSSQNLAFQQQQQWERMRRRQLSAPRPGMNMNMVKERSMVEGKIENPSDFPIENNAFNTMNARHSQLQQAAVQQLQQQQLAAMSLHAQSGNQFRPMASLQASQMQTSNMNMGMVRAQPVKVEGFQELMGGDPSLKHDNSEENKLTSPSK